MYTILLVIHTLLVVFLIGMVLIQRGESDGLGGLGGGGGNQFMTGRASANLLTRTTAILATLFMITSLILAVMASRMTESSIVDTALPVETPAAAEKSEKADTKLEKKEAPAEKTDAKAKAAAPAKKETPSVPKPE